MKKLSTVTVFLSLALSAMSQTLRVGMPAPSIKVGKWVKGTPIEKFERGQIYVVEFWATWCKPCIAAMPGLTSYAKKYEGKVNVIGVSVLEQNTTNVDSFVEKMGDKMNYHVATDQQDSPTSGKGYMSKNWLSATNAQGIPLTIVIGRTGLVEYIGGPDLRSILPQMIAGTWAVISDDDWLKSPLGSKRAEIEKLITSKETYDKAIVKLDAYAKMKGAGRDLYPKAWALTQKALVYMWAGNSSKYVETAQQLFKAYKSVSASYLGWLSMDCCGVLNNVIVWPIVDPQAHSGLRFSKRDFQFAVNVAEYMTKVDPVNYDALDSKAWAYYQARDYEKAQETFELIQKALPNDKDKRESFELFKSKIK